jgi:CheY-like chemotaxis protein
MGPAATTVEALALLQHELPDLTILDINVGGEMVFPVADHLAQAGVPFIILSGHSRQIVPARHKHRPFLQKPYVAATLLQTIEHTLTETRGATELLA